MSIILCKESILKLMNKILMENKNEDNICNLKIESIKI